MPQSFAQAGRSDTPSGSRPTATVLVCTRGRGPLLLDCLRSIASSLGASDELLVVEADSRSGREALEAIGDGNWRWLEAAAPGKSRQLNQGITAAHGDVIVITDDDCRVAPGWVDAMVEPFLEPDVGLAFGPVHGLSSTSPDPPVALPAGPAPPEVWTQAAGASMAVSKPAAFDVGGFDERLGPGAPVHGEEGDLLLRMAEVGWRCWVADAPPVEHMEWRTDEEHARNLLVYERGGGAWVGAALRRDPLAAARMLEMRLRYQAGHFSSAGSKAFAARALAAFCSGLLAGLQLRPTRFLSSGEGTITPGSAGGVAVGPPVAYGRMHGDDDAPRISAVSSTRLDHAHALAALPWPSVRGKRCLHLGTGGDVFALELERRGAADVTALEFAADLDLDPDEIGTFDVVVASPLLGQARDHLRLLQSIRGICRYYLLSIEPLELGLSIVGRGRPLARLADRADASPVWVLNGAAHRQLLEAAGFEVQNVSKPYVAHSQVGLHRQEGLGERIRAFAQWMLTGDREEGVPHRAILSRPGS